MGDSLGVSPMVAGILTTVPVLSFVGDRPYLIWSLSLATAGGWFGIWLAPAHLTSVWAVLLGVGGGSFAWTLTMIGDRTRTAEGTAALSIFAQGLGYLFASVGAFGVGASHGITGGWNASMTLLVVLAVLIRCGRNVVARPATIEDAFAVSVAETHHDLPEVGPAEQTS